MAIQNSSFRIDKDNLYIIEVNDAGETIEFDLDDSIGLQNKLIKCYTEIEKIKVEFDSKIAELEKKEYPEEETEGISQKSIDAINVTTDFYMKSRECVDMFLGKGACQKIFGDRNFPDMFDKLFEKLQPDIEKMGLSIKNIQKNLVNKYQNKTNKRTLR